MLKRLAIHSVVHPENVLRFCSRRNTFQIELCIVNERPSLVAAPPVSSNAVISSDLPQ